ncbi:ABC transporter ATP-binding protein [Parasphingorhabdus pacifica]
MSAVVRVHDVSRRFGDTTALDQVGFAIEENTITGLLGRNGAGKTTLMQILTGQEFPGSGAVEVFGEQPRENASVLSRVCFIKESQKYPDAMKVRQVLRSARLLHPNWDEDFARSLIEDFQLPTAKPVKKLSRGMLSALGVIIGLASRAPLTFFDEPYLGLDAVARQLFYDRLLADYAENPRTVVLSTHLIDEASDLIEHVVVLDRGRVLIDDDSERLRGGAVTVSGPAAAADEFTAAHRLLRREQLGNTARVTVRGVFSASEQERASSLGLALEPVSLQQLIVHTTTPIEDGATAKELSS